MNKRAQKYREQVHTPFHEYEPTLPPIRVKGATVNARERLGLHPNNQNGSGDTG